MKIIKIDKKEYLGKWIALRDLNFEGEGEDVICFGEDKEEVKKTAKEKGYVNPCLIFMSKKSEYIH